ncbi:MAG: methyl-accepting chemotaxis protein [Anaerolineaceae bacterium]|nr:MAG: methyl-accepting chemotaxis protein [Anaerolineaceae bacterium]
MTKNINIKGLINNLRGKVSKESKREAVDIKKIKFGILPKLLLGFILPVALIVILGVISYQKASSGLVSNYEKATSNTISMATSYLKHVTESVNGLSIQYTEDNDIDFFTRGLAFTDPFERISFVIDVNNELIKKTQLEKFIQNIHIIGNEKIPVLTSSMENIQGFYRDIIEAPEGDFLESAQTAYKWVGTHPVIDEKISLEEEEYAISLIRRFSSKGACVVVDINANHMLSFLQELELGKDSIVGLITEDGKEILIRNSGNDEAVMMETSFNFGDKDYFLNSIAATDSAGSQYVKYQSEDYLYMYSKIGDTGLTICGMVPKSSFMVQASEIRFVTFFIVILASVIAVTIGVMISRGIGKALKNINTNLKMVSEGDLTVSVSVNRRDEFAILASSIMGMLGNMRKLIFKMTNVSKLVSVSAANIMDVSKNIAVSNGDITKAVDEIGNGIEGQAYDSQSCLVQMDELSQKITVVYTNLHEIEDLMENMKELVSNGIMSMEQLTKQSEATSNITRYVVSNIEALEEKTKSISNIVQVINDIADQTNLLSLNASIEAARAGDMGRGFAVVASEIRELANKSMTSANEIKSVIKAIKEQTADTVLTAKEAENVVSLQDNAVNHTISAFQNMNSGIEKLIDNLAVIGENMKNMESAREGTLLSVENISAISEETLATSNSIENAVYTQVNSVSSLEEAAKEMGDNAKELMDAINIFRI